MRFVPQLCAQCTGSGPCLLQIYVKYTPREHPRAPLFVVLSRPEERGKKKGRRAVDWGRTAIHIIYEPRTVLDPE